MGPRIPPLEVIATWPAPGVVKEVRSPWSMYIMSVGTTGLAATLILLRLYYRRRAGQIAMDDWLLMAALLCSIGFTIAVSWATAYTGWNMHTWELINNWTSYTQILQAAFALKLLHGFTITLGRWAVLIFYSRLLFNGSGIQPGWKLAHQLIVALVLGAGVSFFFVSIFQCAPVYTYWVLFEGKCMPEGQILLFFGSLNGFLDLLVGALPIPIIMKLNMPLQDKLGVMCLLCLGSAAFVAATVKCYYIYMSLLGDWDMVWWVMPVWISAVCEQNLILICATLPTLNKPLISRPFRKVMRLFTGAPKSNNPTNRSRSQMRQMHGDHVHGMSMGGGGIGGCGNVSTIGKGDEDNLPLRGLVVTREVEMQWTPNLNHKPSL